MFEVYKNKKVNDVEIWSRAVKEEELIAMKLYCEKNGKQEMEKIRKAVEDKHAKELSTKKMLESAQSTFSLYKQKLIELRKDVHLTQQKEFANSIGEKCKTEILEAAKKALTIIEIKKANDE